MNDNSNFIFAVILSLGVLLGWQYFVVAPKEAARQAELAMLAEAEADKQANAQDLRVQDAPAGQNNATALPEVETKIKHTDFATSPRIRIETTQFSGSIALLGARFDDLSLTHYAQTPAEDAPRVNLLAPTKGAGNPWQARFGWIGADNMALNLPDEHSLWQLVAGDTLTPQTPVTLRYDNGTGLEFTRYISVDDNFMFTITQSVRNTGTQVVTLYPFGQITRIGRPDITGLFILHEGPIGYWEESGLQEIDYDDLREDGAVKLKDTGGWLGFTDKYWAAALIPPQEAQISARFSAKNAPHSDDEIYRSDYLLGAHNIPAGGSTQSETRFFVGAKQVDIIDAYADNGVTRFDLLIDWGWFYFLTKPMFSALQIFYNLVGNYGVAILLVTVILKLFFFPLANRSYETMAKMKKLQPLMLKLRETYKDDRVTQQQELMKIYREEKLNPLAGCLPVLLQIPVFFALYKVLFITIDMRHQPFFGWITDLSAADPTSLFNLFGLIPWDPPGFLMLGIWPILMGITMFVQMQMNPAPPDPIQAKIFKYMPLFFTLILASFPAGLVIYWAWNNFLSILQQGIIMRRNGVDIELLENLNLKRSPPKQEK